MKQMKFKIQRISEFSKKPSTEARSEEHGYIDWRTAKTLDEAKLPKNKHWADQFFASGINHREEIGMIARILRDRSICVIEVNTLEELLRLNDKYGSIILRHEDDYHGIARRLEIYDDYRE